MMWGGRLLFWKALAFLLFSASSATAFSGNYGRLSEKVTPMGLETRSRKLDTTDTLNALLDSFEIELPLGQDEPLDLIFASLTLFDPLVCSSFLIGDLAFDSSFTAPVSANGNLLEGERLEVNLVNLQTVCEIAIDVDGDTGTAVITSTKTNVSIGFDVFSEGLRRVIPTFAQVSPDCSDTLDLDISLDFQDVSGLNIVSLILPIFTSVLEVPLCEALENATEGIVDLIVDNPLIDIAGIRAEQPESIGAAVDTAEAKYSEAFESFSLFAEEDFNATIATLTGELLASPMVADVSVLGFELISILSAENATAITLKLEEILALLLEEEVDIPEEIIETLIEAGVFEVLSLLVNDLVNGEVSLDRVVELLLSLFEGGEEGIIGLLPPEIVDILEQFDILELLEDLLEAFKNEEDLLAILQEFLDNLLGGGSISPDGFEEIFEEIFELVLNFTVGDLVDLIPGTSEFEDFLLSYGEETPLVEVLFEVLGEALETTFPDAGTGFNVTDLFNATVGEVVAQIPGANGFEEILLEFGEDTLFLTALSMFIESTIETTNSPFDLLKLLPAFIPETEPIVDFLFNPNAVIQGIIDLVVITLPIDPLGDFILSLSEFVFDIDIVPLSDSAGIAGDSSLVLPGVNLSQIFFGLGVNIEFQSEGVSVFNDTLTVTVDFGAEAEAFITSLFNFDNLKSFGWSDLVSLPSAVPILVDYATCAASSVGLMFGGQRVVSTFDVNFLSESGAFSGLVEDLLGTVLALYAPVVPTLVESALPLLLESFTGELFTVSENVSACLAHPLTVAPTGEPAPDVPDDGDADDGNDAFLGEATAPVLGAAVVILLALVGVVVYFVFAKSPPPPSGAPSGEAKVVEEGEAAGGGVTEVKASL